MCGGADGEGHMGTPSARLALDPGPPPPQRAPARRGGLGVGWGGLVAACFTQRGGLSAGDDDEVRGEGESVKVIV